MLIAGQSLEAQEKYPEAIERFRRMVASAPAERKNDARFSLGVVLYKTGKYSEAIGALSEVKEGAYAGPARLQLGLAQLAAGNPSGCAQGARHCLRCSRASLARSRRSSARCEGVGRGGAAWGCGAGAVAAGA